MRSMIVAALLIPFAAAAQSLPPAAGMSPPGTPAPALAPAVAPSAASATARDGTDRVVAQRGSATLTLAGLHDLLATLEPDVRQKLLEDRQALGTFVRDRMLYGAVLDEAHVKGWDARPDIAARAEQARRKVIVDSYIAAISQPDAGYPTDSDIQAAYESTKAKLFTPKQVHLAQILLAVPPAAAATVAATADKAADDDAHARATDLRAQASKPKTDFAALARKYSDDHRTAPAGGDLGWLREDQIVPQLRTALAGLTDGGLAEPVRLADGWHLVRLVATRPPAPASLAEAHDTLVGLLRQARQQQGARAYLDALLQTSPIQVNEIALGSVATK